VKASEEKMMKALEGDYRGEHLFTLARLSQFAGGNHFF